MKYQVTAHAPALHAWQVAKATFVTLSTKVVNSLLLYGSREKRLWNGAFFPATLHGCSYSYALNKSALLTPQTSIDLYLSCSAAIKFHNITPAPTYHTDPALLMHSKVTTYRQDRPYLPWKQAYSSIVGMESPKTKIGGHDTTTLSHHPYILCHFTAA